MTEVSKASTVRAALAEVAHRGAELILQFDPQTAQACGASLAGTAAKKQ